MIALLENKRTDGVEKVWECETEIDGEYLVIDLPGVGMAIRIRASELRDVL